MSLLVAIFLVLVSVHAPAATLTVVNTLDAGPGSLRQAIADANATQDLDTIRFHIPTSDLGYDPATGVWTISVFST